ncbi:MAG: tryptophan synthase subunit alpha [Elusimicrobiota bacterium]|jgi:tryptophan synthase alpha chain|nr:tryptophan synthase subunit alpha [Elusimicrobiota bacterium]
MQNRINKMFHELKKENKKALITFITAGYLDLEFTEDCVYEMAEKGANIIELGLPFSDPIADGEVIQESSYQALSKGINIDKVFRMVENIRKNKIEIPLIMMTYYNLLLARNLEEVVKISKEVGLDGFIIPDLLPLKTNDDLQLYDILSKYNLNLICLSSILSDRERLKKLTDITKGFLYLIIKVGTTGKSNDLNYDLIERKVKELKEINPHLPVALGFGIDSIEDVKNLKIYADGLILGSKIIKIIKETSSVKKVGEFIAELRQELDN